jgi:hypothetical protein
MAEAGPPVLPYGRDQRQRAGVRAFRGSLGNLRRNTRITPGIEPTQRAVN